MGLNRIHLAGEVTHDTRKVSSDSAVSPGDLVEVKSDGTVKRQASAAADVSVLVAEENTPFNKGLSDDYAVGDQANLIYPMPGAKLQVRLAASGAAVVAGDRLESAGAGKCRKLASGKPLFVVEEAADPTSAITLCKATRI